MASVIAGGGCRDFRGIWFDRFEVPEEGDTVYVIPRGYGEAVALPGPLTVGVFDAADSFYGPDGSVFLDGYVDLDRVIFAEYLEPLSLPLEALATA